jgi:allantoicase
MGTRPSCQAGLGAGAVSAVNDDLSNFVDLASERVGGRIIAASDEFFAPKERLILADPPIWRDGEYTDRGKWMDGWETRRRRDLLPGEPGFDRAHDWCIVQLGVRGRIRGVDVETTHFTGNFPDSCEMEACVASVAAAPDLDRVAWRSAVGRSALRGGSHNVFHVAAVDATHVRLRVFPDGGVARLRVYGEVTPDWDTLGRQGEIDLAALVHGARVIDSSDMYFGRRDNLIMPGPSGGMSDGWETRRRRTPGHEWTVVRLGRRGTIARVEVDTRHFKGNAPAACSLDACTSSTSAEDWQELLPRMPLQPDGIHQFVHEVKSIAAATHVRLKIFPDGGVARLRLFGRLA